MKFCYALMQSHFSQLASLNDPNCGFEIRLDSCSEFPDVKALRAATTEPLIATYRSKPHLGQALPETRNTQGWTWRMACLDAGFDYIDIEMDEEDLPAKIVQIQAGGAKALLSHHDLGHGPCPVQAMDTAKKTKADLIKIIGTGRDMQDFATQRNLYRTHADRNLILFYMGADFYATRILSLVYGAPFTFAALSESSSVAPGQVTAKVLNECFVPWQVDPDALALFGVIGSPIGHSLSPAFHNGPLKQVNPSALFLPFPNQTCADLALLEGTFPELRGLAVTKPMKEQAFTRADQIQEPAIKQLGALNTLLFRDGQVVGQNTDFLAMIELLKPYEGKDGLLVIGYGGLGKAVTAAALHLGFKTWVTNRNEERMKNLPAGAQPLPWAHRTQCSAAVLVQCTSVGMDPKPDETPMPTLPPQCLAIIETIYNPKLTKLMRQGTAAGLTVVDGAALFDTQAEIQNRFFRSTLLNAEET